ncbi:RNA-directed DNA polymerase, eukaryota [Tanacetum coccineum]
MDVKFLWGNSNYQFISSDSNGSSGGILCVWEASVFKKDNATVSDNFIAIYGTWLPSNSKILFVVVYAPQQLSMKRSLWDYIASLLRRWNGESIVMGDFNDVRCKEERLGSLFNPLGARLFNKFIKSSGLVEVKLEGYSFTWSHPSASKMSKLDRFLVTEGMLSVFPSMSAICLDRHLSDHRPILLHEALKPIIRCWVKDRKSQQFGAKNDIVQELGDIDKILDHGNASDTVLLKRMELMRQLHNLNQVVSRDAAQKSKIKWAIEGDENSKFFHGIINKKRSYLSIRGGLFVDGIGVQIPVVDMDSNVSPNEIRRAVWDCGDNKSPGPDGFSFEFFRKYWSFIGPDFCCAPVLRRGSVKNGLDSNLKNVVKILNCFYYASSLKINIDKSQLLGVGVPRSTVAHAAVEIGCMVLNHQFRYLGVMVGEPMSKRSAWDDTVNKIRSRLSNWKVKTLSIGGRLTLLKSVLGASPLYYMSIFKTPKGVLKEMEAIRSKFFNGVDTSERKIHVLELHGRRSLGLRFMEVIQAIYGASFELHSSKQVSLWCSILREVQSLKAKGFDFISHCKKRVGDGLSTRFWLDIWVSEIPLSERFPRLFMLDVEKEVSVAAKLGSVSIDVSFRRGVRLDWSSNCQHGRSAILIADWFFLSSSGDRWICDFSGDGEFRVTEVRNFIDDLFLPSHPEVTRWVKCIPKKINIFVWRARRDCLPTRQNLIRRGVMMESDVCPLCEDSVEESQHVFFQCSIAQCVIYRICRVGGIWMGMNLRRFRFRQAVVSLHSASL